MQRSDGREFNMTRLRYFRACRLAGWPMMAFVTLLLLSGCRWAAIGGSSGALIGGAMGGKRGAMIGGGTGLLAGAAADALIHRKHSRASLSACDSLLTHEERRACNQGQTRAEEQNWRDRVYKAERYGYKLHRRRYNY